MSSSIQTIQSPVQLFKKYVFSPFQSRSLTSNQEELQHITQEIYNWARNNGAQYIAFFAHPMRNSILQKHYTFLSIKFIKQNLIQTIGSQKMKFVNLWKNQLDGSSVPNGGLKQNYQGRTLLIWDHFSQLFIRKRNSILYVPSFIITSQGYALDDRLHFRKTEQLFQQEIAKFLAKFKIKTKQVFLTLGIQQQFYVLPKSFAENRTDVKHTKRLLVGKNPFHSPVSSTYLKKMPDQILKMFKQAQKQLLELGVPIKLRHYESGPNQFEINTQIENGMMAIDHNVLMMQILKQTCQRNGLQAIFHEKPFSNVNGSGKHINYSISYLDQHQKMKNLYDLKSQNKQLLTLFLLITLKAVQDNHKLYIASTMTPGNQLRLGERQAPLPAMSVYLGEEASHLIQNLPMPQKTNLKDKHDFLLKEEYTQLGDRNRTSTLAFSQNRFQFRLPGSSQNVTFPTTIIMITILNQIRNVMNKFESGQTATQIITEYRQYTRNIRYEGNCYSQQWKKQAQKRGLYNPNKTIVQRIKNIRSQCKVLIDSQIYTNRQIQAKYKVMRNEYMDTVRLQRECIIKIINKNIIPCCYSYISTFPRQLHLKNIQNRMRKFDKMLQELIGKVQQLQNKQVDEEQMKSAYYIRQDIIKLGELVDKILDLLPQNQNFPQLNRYLDKWQAV